MGRCLPHRSPERVTGVWRRFRLAPSVPAAIHFQQPTESKRGVMLLPDKVYLGTSTRPEYLALKYGNRHGLVTGATGTGKTVTLQVMAEAFSAAGVPVFAADIKGDLSGIAAMGKMVDWQTARATEIGFTDYAAAKFPTIFWDLFGRQGHP